MEFAIIVKNLNIDKNPNYRFFKKEISFLNPFPLKKVEELVRVKFALSSYVCQLKYKFHRFNERELKSLLYVR